MRSFWREVIYDLSLCLTLYLSLSLSLFPLQDSGVGHVSAAHSPFYLHVMASQVLGRGKSIKLFYSSTRAANHRLVLPVRLS